jgi:hypothetical protein
MLEGFDKLVRDAVPTSDPGNFMHQDLLDLAGRGEFLDAPQSVAIMVICLAGDRLLTDFDNKVAFARGVLFQLAHLAIGFLPRSGDADQDRDED